MTRATSTGASSVLALHCEDRLTFSCPDSCNCKDNTGCGCHLGRRAEGAIGKPSLHKRQAETESCVM